MEALSPAPFLTKDNSNAQKNKKTSTGGIIMFKEFLTVEGERLLTKSITGSSKITFTKVMLGDGTADSSTKNIQNLEMDSRNICV